MAIAKDSLLKNNDSLSSIQKSFMTFGKGLRAANSTSVNIIKGLSESNREKERATQKRLQLYDVRRQAVERKERESVVESGKIGSIFKSTQRTIAGSTKGFLGRIMDFVGIVFVGWMLTNLPTIIKSIQALIERIRKLYSILSGWYDNTETFFRGFTDNLKDVLRNLTGFDFNDDKDEIDKTNEKNKSNISKLYNDINKMIEELSNFSIGEKIQQALSGLVSLINPNAPPGSGAGFGYQPQTTYPAGNFDATKLTNLARSVGMPEDKIPTMVAIALGESGGGSNKHNTKPPDNSYGLWQINMYGALGPERLREFGISSYDDLFDPVVNAKAALSVLKSQGLGAWTVYKTGSYRSYLPQAQEAFSKQKGTPIKPIDYVAPAAPPLNAGTRYAKGQDISKLLGSSASVSSLKGWRIDPKSGMWKEHSGIDISCAAGLYISLRGFDAEVVGTKYDAGGYGYVIDIWVPSLKVQLRFAHNSRILISSGRIPAGTSFAVTGSTGRSTGPHIHFEADTRRNRTDYYSNLSPDPYVSLIRLTGAQIQGRSAGTPSNVPGSANQPPSQTQPVEQKYTPNKQPQTIPIPVPQMDPTRPPSAQRQPGQGGPSIPENISSRDQLNSFISKTLLKELEYT